MTHGPGMLCRGSTVRHRRGSPANRPSRRLRRKEQPANRPRCATGGCIDVHYRSTHRAGLSGSGTHHRRSRLHPLAGAAGRVGHPPVHWHGLRIFGLLAAAVASDRHHQVRRLPEGDRLAGPCGRHDLRLDPRRTGLDLHAVLHLPGIGRRALGRLGRALRPPQDRCHRRVLLVRRTGDLHLRRYPAPGVDVVAGVRRDRRHRPGPGLHLPRVDAHQVVSRPPRHGHRHGDHGLRGRRHDRLAAGAETHAALRHRELRRCVGNLPDAGGHLFRVHDRRRSELPAASGRLAPGRLGPEQSGAEGPGHRQAGASERRLEDAAVLAGVDSVVSQRDRWHRHPRHGLAAAAGGVRRQVDRCGGHLRSADARTEDRDRRDRRRIRGVAVAVQHRGPDLLGLPVRQDRPQDDLRDVLRARHLVVCLGTRRGRNR